jgi:hypothetical protein
VIRSLIRPYDGALELSEASGRVLFRVRLHASRCAPSEGLSTVA